MPELPSYLVIHDSDPPSIHNLKLKGLKLAGLFQSKGASLEWLNALSAINLNAPSEINHGEYLPLITFNSKPFSFPNDEAYLPEIKILAYIRWLIENYQGEALQTGQYREVSITVQLAFMNDVYTELRINIAKPKRQGGKTTAEIKQKEADQDKAIIYKEADKLIESGRNKRDISALIMERKGFSRKKVMEALHSHKSGLWKKKVS